MTRKVAILRSGVPDNVTVVDAGYDPGTLVLPLAERRPDLTIRHLRRDLLRLRLRHGHSDGRSVSNGGRLRIARWPNWTEPHHGRQRLFRQQVAVLLDGRTCLVVGVHDKLDPVGDLEPGVSTCLLDNSNQVTSNAFGSQLRRDLGIQHYHTGCPGQCRHGT